MKTVTQFVVLDQIEAEIDQFANALQTHQTEHLTRAATALQAAVRELSRSPLRECSGTADDMLVQIRLKKIAASLFSQRESLQRHSVMTERTLAALMPASLAATYSPGAGAYAGRSYGSAGRQSGEFRSLCA
jgi:hypothetical protein